MPSLYVPLHKGLVTAVANVHAPPESLREARNCRYERDSLGVRNALGRSIAGGEVPTRPGGAHSFTGSVSYIHGLAWDPGSTADGTAAELVQLLYIAGTPPAGARRLFTLPAREDHSDPGMRTAARRQLTFTGLLPFNVAGVPIAFENRYYLSAGFRLVRDVITGARLERNGMPGHRPEDSISVALDGLAGGATVVLFGIWWYWWTWYDPDTDQEGPAEADDAKFVRVLGLTDDEFRVTFLRSIIKPTANAKVRIYRSLKLHEDDPPDVGTEADTNPWPIGFIIAELDPDIVQTFPGDGTGFEIINTTDTTMFFRDNQLPSPGIPANKVHVRSDVFAFVEVRVDGDVADAARDGTPPRSSALEVFEESLISNDLDDPRKTRFSFPGRPGSFPGTFFINHETAETDRVLAFKVLKNQLGVFMRYGVDRINWLPRRSDQDFNRGRVKTEISRQYGLVNNRAIDKFMHPGLGQLVVYGSDDGIYATDLKRGVRRISVSVEWESLVAVPDATILVNDPNNSRIIVAHQMPGEDRRNHLSYLYYDDAHLSQGGIPAWIGPVDRPAGVIALTRVTLENGRKQVISTDAFGSIHYEDQGLVEQGTEDTGGATATVLAVKMRSQQIYLGGVGFEVHLQRAGFVGSGIGAYTGRVRSHRVDNVREFALDFVTDKLSTVDGLDTAQRTEFEVEGTGDVVIDLVGASFQQTPGQLED